MEPTSSNGVLADPSTAVADATRPADGPPAATSRASIAGHPLHPAMIAFPMTLLSATVAADLVALRRPRDPFWPRLADLSLAGGILTGAAAALPGAVDFVAIHRARRPVGWIHAAGNLVAMGVAAANLVGRRRGHEGPGTRLGLSAGTAALVALTGWAGGELISRQRVGVARETDAT